MSTPVLARHDGADREAPDDAHGRLVARVAAGADEHRQEVDDDRKLLQERAVALEDEGRAALEDEQPDEQRRAVSELREEIGRRAVVRLHSLCVWSVSVERMHGIDPR